jgi:hypothetical protein
MLRFLAMVCRRQHLGLLLPPYLNGDPGTITGFLNETSGMRNQWIYRMEASGGQQHSFIQ